MNAWRPYRTLHDQARRKETRRELLKALAGMIIIAAIIVLLMFLSEVLK